MPTHITAVLGPPCSGKTTYVTKHRQPGDLVVDYDALAQALGSPSDHDHDPRLVPFVSEARDAVLRRATRRNDLEQVWVISTAHTVVEADETIVLDTPLQTCLARARRQGRDPQVWAAIDRWFATPATHHQG